MSNGLLVVILLLVAICVLMTGMSVFSSSRPPDPRVSHLQNEVEELKTMLSQVQKAVLQVERKLEKEMRESRTENKEGLEKMGEDLLRKVKEVV